MKEKMNGVVSLSVERTALANERTFLAYIRTSFSSFILAFALFHFFNDGYYEKLAILFSVAGIIFLIFGIIYFIWRKKKLDSFK